MCTDMCIHVVMIECYGILQVLTSVCWLGNGRSFMCAYSNGCVVQWNTKVENKPEKVFFIHGTCSELNYMGFLVLTVFSIPDNAPVGVFS